MLSDLKRLLGLSPSKKKQAPALDGNVEKKSPPAAVSQERAEKKARHIENDRLTVTRPNRKLKDTDDLYEIFGGKKIDEQIALERAEKEKEKIRLKPVRKTPVVKKNRKLDKNGFPLLSKSEDLLALFENTPDKQGRCRVDKKTVLKKTPAGVRGEGHKRRLDRNGLPILDGSRDLAASFYGSSARKGHQEDDFAMLLEKSLSGKSDASVMREKRDRYPAKPISLKKLLDRYPAPQRQLDLHGYKARKADAAADTFIRNASRDGIYTLRIIVGKGLHSEGGAVLPDVVEDRVVFLKSVDIVLTFKWENGIKSKSGAVLVYLVDRLSPAFRKNPG